MGRLLKNFISIACIRLHIIGLPPPFLFPLKSNAVYTHLAKFCLSGWNNLTIPRKNIFTYNRGGSVTSSIDDVTWCVWIREHCRSFIWELFDFLCSSYFNSSSSYLRKIEHKRNSKGILNHWGSEPWWFLLIWLL